MGTVEAIEEDFSFVFGQLGERAHVWSAKVRPCTRLPLHKVITQPNPRHISRHNI